MVDARSERAGLRVALSCFDFGWSRPTKIYYRGVGGRKPRVLLVLLWYHTSTTRELWTGSLEVCVQPHLDPASSDEPPITFQCFTKSLLLLWFPELDWLVILADIPIVTCLLWKPGPAFLTKITPSDGYAPCPSRWQLRS